MRKYIELMSITKIKLELKKHIKPIFTFFLMATTITLYTNLDTILLGFFSTEEEVGFYVTALKIKNILEKNNIRVDDKNINMEDLVKIVYENIY